MYIIILYYYNGSVHINLIKVFTIFEFTKESLFLYAILAFVKAKYFSCTVISSLVKVALKQ